MILNEGIGRNRDIQELYHNFGIFAAQEIVLIVNATFSNVLAFFTYHNL